MVFHDAPQWVKNVKIGKMHDFLVVCSPWPRK